MAQLEEYDVEIGGVRHTLLLDEADAKRRGAVRSKQADAPRNKARVPENKSK